MAADSTSAPDHAEYHWVKYNGEWQIAQVWLPSGVAFICGSESDVFGLIELMGPQIKLRKIPTRVRPILFGPSS